jgi:hypothetical protein
MGSNSSVTSPCVDVGAQAEVKAGAEAGSLLVGLATTVLFYIKSFSVVFLFPDSGLSSSGWSGSVSSASKQSSPFIKPSLVIFSHSHTVD